MKPISASVTGLAALALIFSSVCAEEGTTEAAAAAEEEAAPTQESWVDPTADRVDISDFLNNRPPPRTDTPERGKLSLHGDDIEPIEMAHWNEYVGTIKAPRWGRYTVALRYSLHRAGLGIQPQIAGQKLKVILKSCGRAPEGRTQDVGTIYLEEAGDVPVRILSETVELHANFIIHEVMLIPAREGERPTANEDGSFELLAKDATTWSTNMRYEPNEKKNCLGFWNQTEDFAEWDIRTMEPVSYEVEVTYGCGAGSGGSEVEVRVGDQSIAFTVEETGGFQNWKSVKVGQIQITEPGYHHVVIQPKTKAGKAVMEIQKVVLRPVE